MTHFVLASDIELYPTPDLIRTFLEMIARNEGPLLSKNPRYENVCYVNFIVGTIYNIIECNRF